MSHPTVNYVTERAGRTAYVEVSPRFYDLDIAVQRSVWDRTHQLAFADGWVLGDDDVSVVDDDGTERYPLARICPLMQRGCSPECHA